jgi:predicted nucleic acid-binding protein
VYLIDNSAWSRLMAGPVPKDRAERVIGWIEEQRVATCLPFLLEAGYSARSGADREALMGRLEHLPRVAIDDEIEAAALQAQRKLAEVGHHRLPPMDVLLAACAHCAAAGVLHYDSDYDRIAEHTDLAFESVWLAPAGSL